MNTQINEVTLTSLIHGKKKNELGEEHLEKEILRSSVSDIGKF